MSQKNSIGIDQKGAENLSKELNVLIADFQLYYQNLRGFHWNVKGPDFFELHTKFEELYDEANLAIDAIAERVLTLGFTPLSSFSDYLQYAENKESKTGLNGKKMVKHVLKELGVLLNKERKIANLAGSFDDEGTLSLMSDYISIQEKHVWMLKAYSGE